MSASTPPSLQDILRARQSEIFVGRDEQAGFFRADLALGPGDSRRRFVISISGQGGVGKTWLVRRFRKIADEAGAVTGCSDDSDKGVPAAMARIGAQFEERGQRLDAFADQYEVYQRRRREIEADPEAKGFAALGRRLGAGAVRSLRRVPVAGILAEFVEEDPPAKQGEALAAYVAQ